MKFSAKNGYVLFSVEETEIEINNIKVYEQRQGTGKELIKKVIDFAKEKGLNVGLYAEPQDDTIEEEDLINFYFSCGFEYDDNDSDGKLLIYKV